MIDGDATSLSLAGFFAARGDVYDAAREPYFVPISMSQEQEQGRRSQ